MSETGYSGRKEELWHSDESCTWDGATEELSPAEARDKGYTACLECCPEGWPDE